MLARLLNPEQRRALRRCSPWVHVAVSAAPTLTFFVFCTQLEQRLQDAQLALQSSRVLPYSAHCPPGYREATVQGTRVLTCSRFGYVPTVECAAFAGVEVDADASGARRVLFDNRVWASMILLVGAKAVELGSIVAHAMSQRSRLPASCRLACLLVVLALTLVARILSLMRLESYGELQDEYLVQVGLRCLQQSPLGDVRQMAAACFQSLIASMVCCGAILLHSLYRGVQPQLPALPLHAVEPVPPVVYGFRSPLALLDDGLSAGHPEPVPGFGFEPVSPVGPVGPVLQVPGLGDDDVAGGEAFSFGPIIRDDDVTGGEAFSPSPATSVVTVQAERPSARLAQEVVRDAVSRAYVRAKGRKNTRGGPPAPSSLSPAASRSAARADRLAAPVLPPPPPGRPPPPVFQPPSPPPSILSELASAFSDVSDVDVAGRTAPRTMSPATSVATTETRWVHDVIPSAPAHNPGPPPYPASSYHHNKPPPGADNPVRRARRHRRDPPASDQPGSASASDPLGSSNARIPNIFNMADEAEEIGMIPQNQPGSASNAPQQDPADRAEDEFFPWQQVRVRRPVIVSIAGDGDSPNSVDDAFEMEQKMRLVQGRLGDHNLSIEEQVKLLSRHGESYEEVLRKEQITQAKVREVLERQERRQVREILQRWREDAQERRARDTGILLPTTQRDMMELSLDEFIIQREQAREQEQARTLELYRHEYGSRR